jgi:hypothetical protein
MNSKEKHDIAINLTILLESIISKDSDSSEIANNAIGFCRDMLKRYPELKVLVEKMISDDWDTQIAWMKFDKEMLK